MAKKGLTTILYVLDRSGSMGVIWNDAVGAFDNFLTEQKAIPGEAEFGLTVFDSEIDRFPITALVEATPLAQMRDKVFPRGSTALLDAVGRTVNEAGAEFAAREEGKRPERVLLVIQTDGQENASREYTAERVKEMIEHQKKNYAWEVLFLGADQDAWAVGVQVFAASASLSYDVKEQGVAAAYTSVNARSFRETGSLATSGGTDARNS